MTSNAFGIRLEAVTAWFSLHHALQAMEDDGRRPVCQSNPDAWSSNATVAVRRDAAEACGHCPARAACLNYAIANGEPQGVFGGHDFTTDKSADRHLRVVRPGSDEESA